MRVLYIRSRRHGAYTDSELTNQGAKILTKETYQGANIQYRYALPPNLLSYKITKDKKFKVSR